MTQPPSEADATQPSLALAEVWEMLDALPTAVASPDLTATTLELAAVPARAEARPVSGPPPPTARWWLSSGGIVLTALLAGIAAGRATAPQFDADLLASLPVVQHTDLLREAGSVAFLEEVAKRGYPPPRRPPPAQSQADVRADMQEFDGKIAALQTAETEGNSRETLAARREFVLQLADPERQQLAKSREKYQRLSNADRRELSDLARALADPQRESLVEAARLWHQWIQVCDPANRRDVIELDATERLEGLDRWTRFDGRPDLRENFRPGSERDRENRRRPPLGQPDFRPGAPDFREAPPDFRREGPPPPPGSRRPRGGPFNDRLNDREPPPRGEIEAPPR